MPSRIYSQSTWQSPAGPVLHYGGNASRRMFFGTMYPPGLCRVMKDQLQTPRAITGGRVNRYRSITRHSFGTSKDHSGRRAANLLAGIGLAGRDVASFWRALFLSWRVSQPSRFELSRQ